MAAVGRCPEVVDKPKHSSKRHTESRFHVRSREHVRTLFARTEGGERGGRKKTRRRGQAEAGHGAVQTYGDLVALPALSRAVSG
uniref:Uncharacterized protein n=1 Tax=Peronospora matthiolae TaxID=2874970 RepID=A0AAV1UFW5_9STRA